MKDFEKTSSRNYIYKGKILNLRCDDVYFENGEKAKREIVEHRGGVCILPLTKNNEILFVKQYRYAYEKEILELPAGKLEINELPDEAIIREMNEEIGGYDAKIIKIGEMYPSPGYTNEIIYLYYTDDFKTDYIQNLDHDEFLDIVNIDYKKAYEMFDNGEIVDAKTAVLLARARNYVMNKAKDNIK